MRRTALLVAVCLTVVTACRPQLGPSPTPTPSSIAGALTPSQAMTVGIHLPGAVGSFAAPVLDIGINGTLSASNVTVTTEPFAGGDQAFIGAERTDAVDLFVSDTATALVANAAGGDLVLISSLQTTSSWRLMTLASSKIKTLGQLATSTIYIDGLHGDEASLLSAMKKMGISTDKLKFVFPDDPVVSFDATQLVDGTIAAAFVRSFDGYIRLAQFIDPATGVGVGESFYREISANFSSSQLGIWASAASITSDDAKIAVEATLIALTQSFAKCRDDVATCSTQVADSSVSYLSVEALAYGINALNASIWPNSRGLFDVDAIGVQEAVNAAVEVGLVSHVATDTLIAKNIVDEASKYWPAGVDRNGASWAPLDLKIP